MPYSSESKLKDTHLKEAESDNVDEVSQWFDIDNVSASSSYEGEALSVRQNYANITDNPFYFISEEHIREAQEFRRKGYNSQIPEVDPELLTQLREAVAAARANIATQKIIRGSLSSQWQIKQIDKIEKFTESLSEDSIQDWISNEVASKSRGGTGEISLGSRSAAQSLARRLESVLQTLIRVVQILSAIDSYSSPEKLHDMLVTELTDALSFSDENTVMQAMESIRIEAEDHNDGWSSLMQTRAATWEANKSATFAAMSEATKFEAKKANEKAWDLHTDPQYFFRDVADYLQSLSKDLLKASVNVSQSETPRIIQTVNNDEVAVPLSRSNSHLQSIRSFFAKTKLQIQTVTAVGEKQAYRLKRVLRYGQLTATPSKKLEKVVVDSIVRSILWQWQQPVIKIQYASHALLTKVIELQKIEEILLSHAVAHDKGNEQKGSDISDSHLSGDDIDTQIKTWVDNRIEEENPENQRAVKVAVLEQLLSADIASARQLVVRLGETEESISTMLVRQRHPVLKLVLSHLSTASPFLKEVDKERPVFSKGIKKSIDALKKALQAVETESSSRDFASAKEWAECAQREATKVKENISAASARLTERPLDEFSRGSRLAKHWANLAKEQNLNDFPPLDAEQVFLLLKKNNYFNGILSSGDPKGYLFATRLAGEYENVRNDELILPMSPEQYTALEKSLIEYIVKWGQKKVSHGVVKIIIELSFEQALDTVTISLSNFLRVPYKIVKASIIIPYKVHKVNQYIMPGQDKPYKAIYGLLGKKIKQLGFNLITAPLPGVVKLAAGSGVTAGATLYNLNIEKSEKKFYAVYERVAQGKKSDKIKTDSLAGMIFDSAIDGSSMAVTTGIRSVWQSKKGRVAETQSPKLSHNYEDNSGHNSFIPSGAAGSDVDPYRKGFDQSQRLRRLKRDLSEHEYSDDLYGTIGTKETMTTPTKRDILLKEMADALADFERDNENQPVGDISRIIFLDQYLYNKSQSAEVNRTEYKKEWLKIRHDLGLISNKIVREYLNFRLIIETYDLYRGRILREDMPHSRNKLIYRLLKKYHKLESKKNTFNLGDAINIFMVKDDFYLKKGNRARGRTLDIASIYYFLNEEKDRDELSRFYFKIINSYLVNNEENHNNTVQSDVDIIRVISALGDIKEKHHEAVALVNQYEDIVNILSIKGKTSEELFLDARIMAAQIYDGVSHLTLTNDRERWLQRYGNIKIKSFNAAWKLLHIEAIIARMQANNTVDEFEHSIPLDDKSINLVWKSLHKNDTLSTTDSDDTVAYHKRNGVKDSISKFDLLHDRTEKELRKLFFIKNNEKFTSHTEFKSRKELYYDDVKYYSQFDKYIENQDAEKEAKRSLLNIATILQLSVEDLFEKVENVKVLSYVYDDQHGGLSTVAPGRVTIIKLKRDDAGAIVISNIFLMDYINRISNEEYNQLSYLLSTGKPNNKVSRLLNGPYYYRGVAKKHQDFHQMLTGMTHQQLHAHLLGTSFRVGGYPVFSHEYPDQENVQHLFDTTLRDAIVGARVIENKAAASYLRSALYSLTDLEEIAYRHIPFYEIIHRSVTDKDYEIDTEQFTLELISVATIVYPAVKGMATMIRNSAIPSIIKSGLKGTVLLKSISKELGKLGLNAGKVFGTAVYELVEPYPMNTHFNITTIFDHSSNIIKTTGFRSDWAVNIPELNVAKPNKQGVYKVEKQEPGNMRNIDFYIKRDGKFYPVKYDLDNRTWRLIPPANSGKSGHQAPVRRNRNGEWKLHSDVGLKGGALKDRLNEIRAARRKGSPLSPPTPSAVNTQPGPSVPAVGAGATLVKMDTPSASQGYKAAKKMSHATQYDHYDTLSLDEKLDLFINANNDAKTRGILAGKTAQFGSNRNLYKAAKKADQWKSSAKKATNIVLAPQDIFLKGKPGKSLSESILMGWALQSAQDANLVKKLKGIFSSPDILENPLYKSLVELNTEGNALRFTGAEITDVKKTLQKSESKLFPTENSSVRVDIGQHTILLSKVNKSGKITYVFYDPNYGLAYFENYKDISKFVNKKIKTYKTPENLIIFYQLDYSSLAEVKIKGKNLNEIMNFEIPHLYRQEGVHLENIIPQDGLYRLPGTHQQADKAYIKVNRDVYLVEWDQATNTWRVFDPANTHLNRVTIPVKRDADGEWFWHTDAGLSGGSFFDEIKNNWLKRKRFKNFRDFTEILTIEANKWPPEPIKKNIHMIWIGTKNLSRKNISLSLDTAQKNPDYNTKIIYDSNVLGYESAKDFMIQQFEGSQVMLIDLREKSYFPQLQYEPSFPYYEQAIRDGKYAQASDILRLLILKYEGGIYKDIDDVQVKGFGSLAFPKGIGIMREYAPEARKSSAVPNTPIAATKDNPIINKTLELAVENYRRGEKRILKLAGPDVFTKALYQEIPGLHPRVAVEQLDQFELAKRQASGMALEKPKSFLDEQLTREEKILISRPYEAIRGLSGYIDSGADHSWKNVPDSPHSSRARRIYDKPRQIMGETDNEFKVISAENEPTTGSLLFDLAPQPGISETPKTSSAVQHESSHKRYPLGSAVERNRSPALQQDGFYEPFGKDSYIDMEPGNGAVIVRAHGYPGDTGHYKAEYVAMVIRDYLDSQGIKLQDIRHIELQSCYSNAGGPFSQAQSIANILQVRVKGYSGKFSHGRDTDPDAGSFSRPYVNPVAKVVSNKGNTAAFHVSEAVLSIRRRLRAGNSSSTPTVNRKTYVLTPASDTSGYRASGRRRYRGRTVIPNGFDVMTLGRSHIQDTTQKGNAATRHIDGFRGAGFNSATTMPVYPTDRSTFMPGRAERDPHGPLFSGDDLTSTRPPTDAFGQIFIRLLQEIPPYSPVKAGLLIGVMLLAGGVGIYAWKKDDEADEARSALKIAEKNLSDLKNLMDSGEKTAELEKVRQYYFGNENLTSEDVQELIDFVRKLRTTATNGELRKLASGELPENFSYDVPEVFTRLSQRWILGFYLHIFGENEADEVG
ncbi:TPA: hypothetical protein JDD69_004088 [Salmonella enterica]|nr:hypothetical protein [Salmonella enterica]